MKKQGFTIAELLITLSIIGVVAAISAPAIKNLLPDANKATVLKHYNAIESTLNQILTSQDYVSYTAIDFANNQSKKIQGLELIDVKAKIQNQNSTYITTLAERLGLELVQGTTYRDSNNASWIFTRQNDTFDTILEIQLDSSQQPCVFNNNNCTMNSTNAYRLKIDSFANITPGDPLTDAYISNIYQLNSKGKDKQAAIANLAKDYGF